jgi:hypothetical protein
MYFFDIDSQTQAIGFNLDVISIENEKMSGVGVLSKNTGPALVSIVLGPSDYPRTADNTLSIILVVATLLAVTRTVGQTDEDLDPAVGATDVVVTGRGPVLVDLDLGVGPNTGSSLGVSVSVGLSADLVTGFSVNYPPVSGRKLKGRVSVFTKHPVDVDSLSSAHRNG